MSPSLLDLFVADSYSPSDWQIEFHDCRAPYLLAEGGRGGGKTTAVLWEIIRDCLMVPKCNCLMLRRTFTGVEKGVEDHFSKYVPRHLYRRHNQQKHVVTFHNGSKLFFGHVRSDKDLQQYQSAEFLTIGFEELTQFTFSQWNYLKGSNRCPIPFDIFGRPTRPRMLGSTNPNGIGAQWVKSLWITKKAPAGEMVFGYDKSDYVNFHSTFEDNPTYAKDKNYRKGLESISDPVLRQAWIPGSWDILAGQFFSNWEARFDDRKNKWIGRHIKSRRDIVFNEWDDRWIAIDWGYEHYCVALWFARVTVRDPLADVFRDGRKTKSIIVCYRELVQRKSTEYVLAERIVDKNWSSAEDFDPIKAIYLSPDRFGKKPEHSIAQNMGDVFAENGMPRPTPAVNDRIDGWRLSYTLLDTDELFVLDTCTDLIESIPKLMRDEKDPEDAQKEGSDLFLDACEAFRYGVMSYAMKAPKPADVEMAERLQAIKDPTARYMEYLRLSAAEDSGRGLALPVPRRSASWKQGG